MDTDKEKKFLYGDETRAIIGCAFEVLNDIGHGLHEKIYENALVVEFGLQGIPYSQQPEYDVIYKTVSVGKYVPDLITHGKIVIDTKTIEKITDHERGKMLNYLNITGMEVGLIINFKHAKLEWARIAR
jgi:GxxExxY protein